MKSEVDQLKDGLLLEAYSQKYMLKVYEAFGIGRVRFTMLPIGKKGKDNVDFYMPLETFRVLCEEIKNETALKRVVADTASYPAAYTYVTGEDGALRLNIGGSQVQGKPDAKACRIQMQDSVNKRNYLIKIAWDEMKKMAFYFDLTTGMLPMYPASYIENLYKAFLTGCEARGKFYKNPLPEDQAEVKSGDQVEDEQPEATEKKEPVKKEEEKKDDENPILELKVVGEKTINKNFYVYPVKHGDADMLMAISIDEAGKLPWFETFDKNPAGEDLKIVGEVKGKFVRFVTGGPVVQVYSLIVKGEREEKDKFYLFNGKMAKEDVILMFNKEVGSEAWFADFEKAAKNGTAITVRGEKRGKYILYREVAGL